MVLERIVGLLYFIKQICGRVGACIQMSPIAFVLITTAVLVLLSLILVFNMCMAKLFSVPGAMMLNTAMIWLLLRLIVRFLVFPGSILLFKRNTEASYRVEMARQFAQHLEQLQVFLKVINNTAQPGDVTTEGAMWGCKVIEGLARNFRLQQGDQVHFTKEQVNLRLLVQGVETWLGEAKVLDRRGRSDSAVPLSDWLQRESQKLVPVSLHTLVANSMLAGDARADAPACLDRVEQLLVILEGLQKQQEGFCASARRFLRVPTVGSLHQLRAELLVRYSGHQYWVQVGSGRKLDAMLISCQTGDDIYEAPVSGFLSEVGRVSEGTTGSVREMVPLKQLIGAEASAGRMGPVVIWCNPNAAYYETMAYESHWLDFYLSQGCSVLLFNYSGFGRSQGSPTPSAVAADGDAVVDFLKRRGFENIGVHGRSIGGIAACSLAAAHPDVVKYLCADRTFSTLASAARFTFGNWAVTGLSVAATWADNLKGFSQARCYKVMVCDPKDCTIPDLAALRTAIAMQAIEQAAPNERFLLEEDKINRLVEAWAFFETVVGICDREDTGPNGQQGCANCWSCAGESKRFARQTVVGKPSAPEGDLAGDNRLEVADEEGQRLVASGSAQWDARKPIINGQWLEEHMEIVRLVMSPHCDNLRVALDTVGTQLNSSGLTLDDALGRPPDEASYALKCFLANLQVWGSLGNLRHGDKLIELLLQKGNMFEGNPELSSRLSRAADSMTPDKFGDYHRRLARLLVATVRREYRQSLSTIQRSMEAVQDDGPVGAELREVLLSHLKEVESLLTSIYRFFKCVDIAGQVEQPPPVSTEGSALHSDDEDVPSGIDKKTRSETPVPTMGPPIRPMATHERNRDETWTCGPVLPQIDRQVTGYCMCVECGHNGVLSDGELQQLARHIKAAGFGKYAADEGGPQPTMVRRHRPSTP